MIGWENNQGAYFIKKLNEALGQVNETIGKLSSLATSYKTSIVGAINEVFNMAKSTKLTNPVTMEDGFTATVLAGYKQGKVVIMTYQFSVANLTANTNTKIGTIATAHKPLVEQYFTGMIGAYANSGTMCKFILKDDGSIQISVPSNVGESAVAVRGTFIYVSA